MVFLSACQSHRGGGYYQDDGPPKRGGVVDVSAIPDAVPQQEPLSRTGNKPYTVMGKRYYPLKSADGYRAAGEASWYGKKFHGRPTSSGEPYDIYKMTAAHTTLPLPTYVRVTNQANGRAVVVKVNDRGPFLHGRIIDLSYVAAKKLDMLGQGTANVVVEAINPSRTQSVTTAPSVLSADQQLRRSRISDSDRQPLSSNVSPNISPEINANRVNIEANGVPAAGLATSLLQLGAFSSPTNADNLRIKLSGDGFANSRVLQKDGFFKVLLGPVRNVDLQAMQQRLFDLGYQVRVVSGFQ